MKNLKVQLAYKLGGFTDKDNIKILIDPGVLMNIVGTTMDFETNRLTSEFIFINPNNNQ